MSLDEHVFALLRSSQDKKSHVLCLHNVSGDAQRIVVSAPDFDHPVHTWRDLLSGEQGAAGLIDLSPYAVRWLKIEA